MATLVILIAAASGLGVFVWQHRKAALLGEGAQDAFELWESAGRADDAPAPTETR